MAAKEVKIQDLPITELSKYIKMINILINEYDIISGMYEVSSKEYIELRDKKGIAIQKKNLIIKELEKRVSVLC